MSKAADTAATVVTLAPGEGLRAAARTLMDTGIFGGVFVAGVFVDADTGELVATSGMIGYSMEVVPTIVAELRRRANELEAGLGKEGADV